MHSKNVQQINKKKSPTQEQEQIHFRVCIFHRASGRISFYFLFLRVYDGVCGGPKSTYTKTHIDHPKIGSERANQCDASLDHILLVHQWRPILCRRRRIVWHHHTTRRFCRRCVHAGKCNLLNTYTFYW